MRKTTSLYFDVVRFTAALTVFAEHLREHTRNDFGALWHLHPSLFTHLEPLSQTAVIVFFVLSGYVIAYVLATRESSPVEYAASRFARLYSVVLPALFLIAACNLAIRIRFPMAFGAFESDGTEGVALTYITNALFVNRFWLWPDLDLPNGPFWTLSVGVTYYIAIAIFAFGRGYWQIIGLLALFIVAGPMMILLAPVWLLGYIVYHVSQKWQLPIPQAVFLWLVSIILLAFCSFLELRYRENLTFLRTTDQSAGEILAAYAGAICFSINLLAFDAFADCVGWVFAPFKSLIRWLGSITFAFYLFHQSLLSLFTVYHMPDRSSASQLALLVGRTFLVVATLGRFCESTKGAYKHIFLAVWHLTTQPAIAAVGGRSWARGRR